MADHSKQDAHDLGHYYARALIRKPRERSPVTDLAYKQQTARLSEVVDLVVHAYALDSTPPVDVMAFIADFKAGFYEAFREAEGKQQPPH